MKSIKEITKEVRRVRSKSKFPRYSKQLVDSVVLQIESGEKITHLASATGISRQTLRVWCEKSQKLENFVKVQRWPKESKPHLKLYFPDGRWVEGLSLEDLNKIRADFREL